MASITMDEDENENISHSDRLPSPIPTGKGIRSAADACSIFSEHIDKSKQVPELVLPVHIRPATLPADLDYQSLLSGEKDSVNRLLRSALQVGVFQITTGHGISGEEFKSTLIEYDWVLKQLTGYCCGNYGDRDEFVWSHSDKELGRVATNILMSEEKFQTFSKKMDNIAHKLEAVAQEVAQIMAAGTTKQVQKRIQISNESILVLHRYHHQTEVMDQTSISPRKRGRASHELDSLCLHFALEPAEFFCLQSQQHRFSLRTKPDTIIVIVGIGKEHLQDIRVPRLKLTLKPDIQKSGTFFSIELKWSSSHSDSHIRDPSRKLFSLVDQISIVLIVALLYKICSFLLC